MAPGGLAIAGASGVPPRLQPDEPMKTAARTTHTPVESMDKVGVDWRSAAQTVPYVSMGKNGNGITRIPILQVRILPLSHNSTKGR